MFTKKVYSCLMLFLLCFSLIASFYCFNVEAQSSYIVGSQTTNSGGILQELNNRIVGSVYTMPAYGVISNMSIYLQAFGASVVTGKCAVYVNSSKTLVAETVESTITFDYSTDMWCTLNFSSPVALESGVAYLFCFWGSVNVGFNTVFFPKVSGDSGQGYLTSSIYNASYPTTLTATSGAYAYPLYSVYSDNTVISSSPAIAATVTINSTAYSTPSYFSLNGERSFTAQTSKVYSGEAYTFDHWLINGTTTNSSNPVTLNITASTTLTACYTELAGVYHFYGPYNETTGELINDLVTVTAHYPEDTDLPAYSFTLNGTWVFPPDYNVMYYSFLFSDGSTREYWVDQSEIITDIYVFMTNDPTSYVINFLDYTGILQTYPYVTIKAYVNGSLFTVEKRMVDAQNNIGAVLSEGEKYELTIGNDEYSFVYGDLYMTSTVGFQLVLRGVDLPKESLLMYKYVTLYAHRDFSSNSIFFFYNDTKEATTSVTVTFTDENGVVAYENTYAADTVSLNWTGAVNATSYQLDVAVVHEEYGEFTWKQYFPNAVGDGPAMFDFSFMGDWSFDMTYLFPAILILFAAGLCSALNADVGAILLVLVAIVLTLIGWIPIPVGSLIAGFAFAVLMALMYNKRRATIG
jgi:hypothetical protein